MTVSAVGTQPVFTQNQKKISKSHSGRIIGAALGASIVPAAFASYTKGANISLVDFVKEIVAEVSKTSEISLKAAKGAFFTTGVVIPALIGFTFGAIVDHCVNKSRRKKAEKAGIVS